MSPDDASLPRGKTVVPPLVQVHFDGACQPPRGGGIATYGFTVEGSGLEHEESGLAVPPWSPRATNNVAEYTAATRALEWLASRGFRGQVIMLGDSELVVRQMEGEYKVRAEHLRAYQEHLEQLTRRFEGVKFSWIPREENTRADELSKEAIARERRSAGRHRPPTLPAPVPEEEFEEAPGGGDGR